MHRRMFVLFTVLGSALSSFAIDLHVSPTGDNANPGTLAKPLATLTGARDAVRRWKQSGKPPEAATVHFASGTYSFDQPVDFTSQDSGNEAASISYVAERGRTVRFTGGREVTAWHPVTNSAILNRLPPEARAAVVVADLHAHGITGTGRLAAHGMGAGSPIAEAELFYDDAPMTLARWPNNGFRGVKTNEGDLTVIVDTDRMARWTAESEPWVFAYWHYDWAELYEPLAGVDATRQALLRTAGVKPAYGIDPKQARWYAFNLLSELDLPGEYYIDHTNGLLYFWPPQSGGHAVLSWATGLIRADDLSHVTFRGFILEACRSTAIEVKGGEDCHIFGCTIRNTGHGAVQVAGGQRHEVCGCDVYGTGEGGIAMSGGQRETLTPAHHNAENNHVHHYARRARTYKPGITTSGVGNRIAHNLIHDGPHMALSAGGNNHVVEFNEVHNVVEDSGDAGAYYVGRDWTQRGNLIRYNFWHDILGSTGFGGMTIYLDDQLCGQVIYGNLFVRCMQAVFIGGGDDNVVTNNVFLQCWKAAHLDNRGMGWQKKATDDPKGTLRQRLDAMPYSNTLWLGQYPTLANILEDDPGVPKRNVFARNLSAGGKWDDIAPSIRSFQVVTNNLVFDTDPEWARLKQDSMGHPVQLEFKDPDAVKAIGFIPLPLEQMGLYADERRASWPALHEVRPVKLPESTPQRR